MKQFNHVTKEQLNQVVEYIFPLLSMGTIVFLEGPLGAGKTTLVQLLAKKLNIQEAIVSPTFTIAKPYPMDQGEFLHIDAYRLSHEDEDQQWIEMCDEGTLCFIEWPTHLKSYNHLHALKIFIDITSLETRTITIQGLSDV
jgi:tRNA threonylcarbamoyladenosine biosynthesis protein TsaE